jgi:RNA polymerase sigma-70 factor (ECF subfamily)
LLKILASQKIFGSLAEDLIQESWRVFFENLDSFRGDSQIKTYVAGILVNRVREHRREVGRESAEEDVERLFDQAFTEDGHWRSPVENPARVFENREILKFIEECMAGLTPTQREAFSLKEIQQEETKNICNILGVSVPHLGVLIFRAKEKLRMCLEGKVG